MGPNLLRSSLGPPHGSKIEKFVFGGLCQTGAAVGEASGLGVVDADAGGLGDQSNAMNSHAGQRISRRGEPSAAMGDDVSEAILPSLQRIDESAVAVAGYAPYTVCLEATGRTAAYDNLTTICAEAGGKRER